jgi:CubicO group peptidase (beta-lactamase class C family)
MASKKRKKKNDVFEFFHVDEHWWPQDLEINDIVVKLIKLNDREPSPGVAVAVRVNQQLAHFCCYGYADLEKGTRISPDTIFDLGSLSKQFTAMAILNLVINKQIALTDPLSKFFKKFPRYSDSITIEDLLHHTSALPSYTDIYVASRLAEEDWYDRALAKADHWYPNMELRRRRELTNKDVVQWITTQKLLPHPPDTEFEYSNSGYVVLAELVAKITGKRLSDYLKENLFDEMDMTDTYVFDEASRFSPGARQLVNHAKCYNRVDGRYVPVGYTPLNFINGDGNVHSTIKDLLRWELSLSMVEFLGLCFPDELLKAAEGTNIREMMWAPVLMKRGKQVNYGAGWHLRRGKYRQTVEGKGGPVITRYETRAEYHRGVWLGWRNYFARASKWPVPKPGKNVDPRKLDSLGIIVLSNADFGDKRFTTCRIAQEISRLYWGRWKKDNIMNSFNCG